MKVSISTKSYESEGGNGRARSIFQVVPVMREIGFESLDLNLKDYDYSTYLLRGEDWKEKVLALKQLADSVDMEFYQAHSPTAKGGRIYGNPQFSAPGAVEEYREMVERNVIACSMLGVKWLIIHPITCPEYNYERRATLQYNLDFWSPFVELAGKLGTGLAFENQLPHLNRAHPYKYCEHYDDLLDLVDGYGVPQVGVCWDTGHANQNKFDQYRAITTIGSRLKALHLHDNFYGNKDEHMFPFMGEVSWEKVIRALAEVDYEGAINLETNKPVMYGYGEFQKVHLKLAYETACYLRNWLEREKTSNK
ncbi:MAG: sugar phosphate isomerase/epimerase [Lachnospiraceae bacterium]|nr:sugar phosphate isomerase/epimerase [Lachnospiraceae bacterium]